MVGFYPLRTVTTEKRYAPAFFQRGKKVLTPVHAYGYCDNTTKPYAQMLKELWFPHLDAQQMFKVGQRVGVVVSEIAVAEGEDANYWSDGTIEIVNPYGQVQVRLDKPIGIAYDGDAEIRFLDDQQVDVSNVHLWNTSDKSSYVTAVDDDITDSVTAAVYNPATVVDNRIMLACSLDISIPGYDKQTTKYFILKTGAYTPTTGSYTQDVAEEFVTYSVTHGQETYPPGMYYDAASPIFWDLLGHTDGSIINIQEAAENTWFKDRAFLFRIRGELMPAEEQAPAYYKAGTVVYLCNPFNVDNTQAPTAHKFVIAVPGTVQMTTNPIQLPVDTNLWADGWINGDDGFLCDFRCAVDSEGMPYVENIGNDANCEPGVHTSGNEIYCVYRTADMIQEKFKNCTFDVFLRGKMTENDLMIGGQISNDRFACDIYRTGNTLEEIFMYAGIDGATGKIEKATYPVLLSKINIVAAPAPDSNTRSVGSWEDAEYFNGKFWFASGTMLKPANELLEFDPIDTVPVPAAIVGLKALANMLFIMTTSGIYTINLKEELEMLSTVVPRMWAAVGESLYVVDENGQIHNTEFTPVPVRDQRKNTENPYMVLAQNTKMISDISDQWTVFDIANGHGMLWVASDDGLWTMNHETKAWFKVCNDVFTKLITIGDEVYGIIGTITAESERNGIDLKPIQDLDKGPMS